MIAAERLTPKDIDALIRKEVDKCMREAVDALIQENVDKRMGEDLERTIRQRVDERVREDKGEAAYRTVDLLATFLKQSTVPFFVLCGLLLAIGVPAYWDINKMKGRTEDDLRSLQFQMKDTSLAKRQLDEDFRGVKEEMTNVKKEMKKDQEEVLDEIEEALDEIGRALGQTLVVLDKVSAAQQGSQRLIDLQQKHDNQRFSISITHADPWSEVHEKAISIQKALMDEGFTVPFSNISAGNVDGGDEVAGNRLPVRVLYHGQYKDIVDAAEKVRDILKRLAEKEQLAVSEELELKPRPDRRYEIEIQLAATEGRETTGSKTATPAPG